MQYGSVILLSKEQNTKMGEAEEKVVQSAASFLRKPNGTLNNI